MVLLVDTKGNRKQVLAMSSGRRFLKWVTGNSLHWWPDEGEDGRDDGKHGSYIKHECTWHSPTRSAYHLERAVEGSRAGSNLGFLAMATPLHFDSGGMYCTWHCVYDTDCTLAPAHDRLFLPMHAVMLGRGGKRVPPNAYRINYTWHVKCISALIGTWIASTMCGLAVEMARQSSNPPQRRPLQYEHQATVSFSTYCMYCTVRTAMYKMYEHAPCGSTRQRQDFLQPPSLIPRRLFSAMTCARAA